MDRNEKKLWVRHCGHFKRVYLVVLLIDIVQLINHEVSCELVEKVKEETGEFFMLPLEEKKKYAQKLGDAEGFGQAFVISEEQKLDWCDMFRMITLPHDLRKPHLLPKLPHAFRLYPSRSSF
ncbi:putative codeine 3-O-demethylase [Helianthus annuus]|nr:putative codeine 3-O-demethylase [Helianthus annuus]KAJ0686901.1 putative codeine 3-O-demethylase [Helianthus annuus]